MPTANATRGAKKRKPGRRAREPAAKRARAYHHGDLRRALLAAGETELAEKGLEGFTLRGCARRAGVSHAAPAHHFRDARALLTALATEGFRRFAANMRTRMKAAGRDPRARLAASGLGYLDFALDSPALFRLMFASDYPDRDDEALQQAGEESFAILLDAVKEARGRDPRADADAMTDAVAAWSLVHGLANLLLAGRLPPIAELAPAEKEKAIRSVIDRLVVTGHSAQE
ncbi:TetR/AcrR family transcriptional regulator [Amphiplicatus metriothermophilus]|uniref:Transcriptional regulator, TetR family n=1 Tax=Amphiplicatus metriothermophilus TaxID=1519374 RepID=A0A239PJI3_9PROT|nr:TetR/AcrR family transcriptional regulator [Amphiplicatus metriothermophilus]MBB5517714.1 AcrR family transcriptional regulator [Amphiplicatus metriothermophilus]SNT67952.1 transcriptional regulator, TetR family [Amphiplicatus metriothermophilus]